LSDQRLFRASLQYVYMVHLYQCNINIHELISVAHCLPSGSRSLGFRRM